MDGGVGLLQIVIRAKRRVDDQEAAAGKAGADIVGMNGKIGKQHFRDTQRLEARMHQTALRSTADGIPHQIRAARPAPIGVGERLQHGFQFIEAFVRWIDEHQAAPLIGRQVRFEGRIAVAYFGSNSTQGFDFPQGGAGLRRLQFDEQRAVLLPQACRDERGRSRVARQALAASGANGSEIVGQQGIAHAYLD